MSIDSATISSHNPAIEFKSSTFSVPALLIRSHDLTDIAEKLHQKIQQAPDFFKNSPVLLDIHLLEESGKKIDTNALIKLIREKRLIPIALKGGNPEQNKAALKLGVSIQSAQYTQDHDKPLATAPKTERKFAANSAVEKTVNQDNASPAKIAATSAPLPSTTIFTPVRSGQRIYAHGDLIVLAQVSAGAEIMAEGNIHVYSSLRGRALAGVLGNTESRIFCFDLQAELVSIAGNYKVSDDLDLSLQHKPVQVYLQDHALIIKELSPHHFGG